LDIFEFFNGLNYEFAMQARWCLNFNPLQRDMANALRQA